jgi:hypothetical protein
MLAKRREDLVTIFLERQQLEGYPQEWRTVSYSGNRRTLEDFQGSQELAAKTLNDQEATIAHLRAELLASEQQRRSLLEDLSQYSTFEQICNSGMLRNLKIDSESPFAQTILSLLQKTMELQISHLSDHPVEPLKEAPGEVSPDPIPPSRQPVPAGTDDTVPTVEGTT